MWKCPVCEEIFEGAVCGSCGLDLSMDYEQHPTFAPIAGELPAVAKQREIWNRRYADNLRCAGCGERKFVIGLSNGAIRCYACGLEISAGDISALLQARKGSHDPAPKIPEEGCAAIADGNSWRGQCSVGDWTHMRAIAAGSVHTVGLRADGTVAAIGSDSSGQCQVAGWTDITAIAAGAYHTVGLKADGTVAAVGDSSMDKCRVDGWADIVAIAAGENHTAGLCKDGTVVLAGASWTGQGMARAWTDMTAIACGRRHTVGLRADGTVMAVGENRHGQCQVAGWKDIVAIAAGDKHTVGLRADGTVVLAGALKGQEEACAWKDITAIAAGWDMTAAIRADGSAVCTCQGFRLQDWKGIAALALGSAHIVGLLRP